MSIISLEEAQKRKIIENLMADSRYNGNLGYPEGFLEHCRGSAEVMADVVDRAIFYFPDQFRQMDTEVMKTAAYLHDIGRILRKKQIFHELRGAEFIEDEGLNIGLADPNEKMDTLYKFAQIIRPHFAVYEQFWMEEHKDDRKEFEGEMIQLLLVPSTWNESMLVYSDLSNLGGNRITPRERMEELESRCSSSKGSREDELRLKAIKLGKERVLRICDSVDNLVTGNMDYRELNKYGILL